MDFTVHEEGVALQAHLTRIGTDLVIVIEGGDVPHVGAVTMCAPGERPQTRSFPSHDGRRHKDGVLGDAVAKVLAPRLAGSCTITSGLHIDSITQAQIDAAIPLAHRLGEEILGWLVAHPAQAPTPRYYSDDERPPGARSPE